VKERKRKNYLIKTD